MRRFTLTCVVVLATACGGGDRGLRGSGPTAWAAMVPAGTRLAIQLAEPVSPLYQDVGSLVEARTVRAVRDAGGQTLVPRGAPVYLRVTDRRGLGPRASLWLRAEGVELGQRVQRMHADIVAASLEGNLGTIYRDQRVRGELPRGTLLDLRLERPIYGVAAGPGPRRE